MFWTLVDSEASRDTCQWSQAVERCVRSTDWQGTGRMEGQHVRHSGRAGRVVKFAPSFVG